MRTSFSLLFTFSVFFSFAQSDSLSFFELDTETRLKQIGTSNLKIGGYGQIDYNQALDKDFKTPGLLDVHRIILFFGYDFSSKWELITEIELEHVSEIYVEQAYLAYKHNKYINFKGGLILIPMGYINEYHEPTVFLGVERPLLDSKIVPTTWREIGFGIYGRIPELSIKYQLYIVNGFNGYNSSAKFDGDDAYRGGRQKGAESIINSPSISSKIELYGIKHIKLGISGYLGKSQSSLYSQLSTSNLAEISKADSSVVSTRMIGLDASYNHKGLQLRGQTIFAHNKNVEAYNKFGHTDLGEDIFGYYFQVAYNVLGSSKTSTSLLPFLRYENFDTHFTLSQGTTENPKNHRKALFAGFSYFPVNGVVLKGDFQWVKTNFSDKVSKGFNLGIGYQF